MSGLFKWGGQKPAAPAVVPAGPAASDSVVTSKVFPRFLSAVGQAASPTILDLGPVVGANISFFGERLSCKIHVQDLFAEVEALARSGARDTLSSVLASRLQYDAASIDGILCWDLFDFLDREPGRQLAARLTNLLRSGGALYGLFGTTPIDLTHYTRFVVEADDTLRLKTFPATPVKRHVLLNRDINKMFDGLAVKEAVLLKTSTRETLFRKP